MNQDWESTLIIVAELTIKADHRNEFLAYAEENLSICRSADGNVTFDILIDEARANTVVFYEVWKSKAAQQSYMTWRNQRGDFNTLMSYLANEPKFTELRRLAT